jgi:hypothetical protein
MANIPYTLVGHEGSKLDKHKENICSIAFGVRYPRVDGAANNEVKKTQVTIAKKIHRYHNSRD